MRAEMHVDVEVVYADGRVLVVTTMEGWPTNHVDVTAYEVHELDQAIGMAMRSLRRQLVERLYRRLPGLGD